MPLEFDGVNGIIKNTTSDGDVTIKGNDGGSEISLLTFDVSAEGAATFNSTITSTASTTITVADNSDNLTLVSTDADANSGPNLRLYRNSSSPADSDVLGQIDFEGRNDNSQDFVATQIKVNVGDVSDGTEDAQIEFDVMTAGTLREYLRMASGSEPSVVINEDSQDIDFRVESNGNANMLMVNGGGNRVGIGADPDLGVGLHIKTGDSGGSANANADELILEGTGSSSGVGMGILSATDGFGYIVFGDSGGNAQGGILYHNNGDSMRFSTNDAERVRIDSDGNVLVAKTSASGGNTVGIQLQAIGQGLFTRDGGTVVNITRNSDDGELIKFIQDGSLEGDISVSGTTVSFNGFTGSHWSRLVDNSKPTILRGTIMDSIDEMCDWYQAVAEVAESTDDEGNVTPAHTVKESIALGDKSVGDAITFTSNGTEYTGTIVKEGDVKHIKCKVSDTADSKKVYGVFSNWDDQDDGLDGDVNDMNIAQVGTYIIRVNKDVTVSAGDLLVSNGDGTAKLQDDDIIRSKTVAKVNSNIKVETYSDGSYTVPCTLHC